MDFITGVYYFYTFFALYFILLFVIVYLKNYDKMFYTPKLKKIKSLSIVVPCYNEESTIRNTIEKLLKADYKGLKKIIVVDDCSKDGSFRIIKECERLYNGKVLALKTPKNTGRAAGSKNYGAKFVDTELIGFSDADSVCKKNAISKMIGFFEDKNVGGVTSRVLVKNTNNVLEKMQSVEYKTIAFTRKIMEFIESIYVTNGPLSIYRKDIFDKINGFDESNLTEDIELTWHIINEGYKVKMALDAIVYTEVPSNLKVWMKQRIRWNVGGMQTAKKYANTTKRRTMLGKFILPYFVISWFIGLSGLGVFLYRATNYIMFRFLSTKLSIESQVAIITMKDLMINPTILMILGLFLLLVGLAFLLLSLTYSTEENFKYKIHEILIYSFFYVLIYPIILITSGYKFLRGYNSW